MFELLVRSDNTERTAMRVVNDIKWEREDPSFFILSFDQIIPIISKAGVL